MGRITLLCAILLSTTAAVSIIATESPEGFATVTTGPCVNRKMVRPNVQGLSSIPVAEVSPAGIPYVCLNKQHGQICKREELTPLRVTSVLSPYLGAAEGTEIGPADVLQYNHEHTPEGFTSLSVTSRLGQLFTAYMRYINLQGLLTSEEVEKVKQRSLVLRSASAGEDVSFSVRSPDEIVFFAGEQVITYSLVLDGRRKPTDTYMVDIENYDSGTKQTYNATVGHELKAFLDEKWGFLEGMENVLKLHCPECANSNSWFWHQAAVTADMTELSLQFAFNLRDNADYFVKMKKGDTISVSPEGTFTLLGKYDVDVSVAMEAKEGIQECQRLPKQRELFGALMQYCLLLLQQDPSP